MPENPGTQAARRDERIFPALPEQVREARRFLASFLYGCPTADAAILCLSELVSNSILHSASSKPGAKVVVRAEVRDGTYVHLAVSDDGGPWIQRAHDDDRPHGLDIVAALAVSQGGNWGVLGDATTGWTAWATLGWSDDDATDQDLAGPSATGTGHRIGHFTGKSEDA